MTLKEFLEYIETGEIKGSYNDAKWIVFNGCYYNLKGKDRAEE